MSSMLCRDCELGYIKDFSGHCPVCEPSWSMRWRFKVVSLLDVLTHYRLAPVPLYVWAVNWSEDYALRKAR